MKQKAMNQADYCDSHADICEIINGVPHGVAIANTDLKIVMMNSFLEVQSGYKIEDARGVDVDDILKSSLCGRDNQLHRAIAQDDPVTVEGDIITAQRKKLPVRFTLKPLKGKDGKPSGLFILMEDISLFKEMAAKAFTGGIQHAIVGNSLGMQEILERLPVLASTGATLLITGETGTGKDLLAETIHKASRRSRYPFIKINCGALPESLLESELFGHVKGAFTGAHADKPGMFRLAQGGTIYLTEIGDLPLPLQVKLLTVLDDREFFPVGATRKVSVDVRLITATHHDLKRLVREGKFREDLYFRLNVLRSHMPPLRDRDGDLAILLNHFLRIFSDNLQKKFDGFSKKALEMIESYDYPGNVRELCNIVEYAATMCGGGKIMPEHLPAYLSSPGHEPYETQTSVKTVAEQGSHDHYFPHDGKWSTIEKRKIFEALMKTGGNRGEAARVLGWGRSTLWRKIRLYGIE